MLKSKYQPFGLALHMQMQLRRASLNTIIHSRISAACHTNIFVATAAFSRLCWHRAYATLLPRCSSMHLIAWPSRAAFVPRPVRPWHALASAGLLVAIWTTGGAGMTDDDLSVLRYGRCDLVEFCPSVLTLTAEVTRDTYSTTATRII